MAHELRLGLVDGERLRSTYWKVRVNGDDVYVTHEVHGPHGMKISLHESGRYHMTSAVDGGENVKWTRPAEQHPGSTHVLTIGMLPGRPVETEAKQPTKLYPPAPTGHMRSYSFFLEDANQIGTNGWPGQVPNRSQLVARIHLDRSERLCIVTWEQPFDLGPVPMPKELDEVLRPPLEDGRALVGYLWCKNTDGSVSIVDGPINVGSSPTRKPDR